MLIKVAEKEGDGFCREVVGELCRRFWCSLRGPPGKAKKQMENGIVEETKNRLPLVVPVGGCCVGERGSAGRCSLTSVAGRS